MKKILPFFLSLVIIIYNILPTFTIKADSMPTSSQYEQIGAFAFSQLLQSGEATEIDFSNYTGSGTDFLIDLGQALFTGDFTGLIQYGLNWLGDTADNVISSIQDSVHQLVYNMSPNLYNAWYGDVLNESYIELQDFDKTNHIGFDLRRLFTPPDETQPDIPSDLDFILRSTDFNWYYTDIQTIASGLNMILMGLTNFQYNPSLCSFMTMDNSNGFTTNNICPFSIGTIHINDYLDGVIASYDNFIPINWGGGNVYSMGCYGLSNGLLNVSSVDPYNHQPTKRTEFPSLTICINYIYSTFRHVNIYYNNEPWVIVSQNTPSYPIILDDLLSIWDGQQLNYEFPDNTYIDLSSLTSIIRTAIDNSDVVHWSDIESTYVDINGQQAVAVTRIYRNDDDNLYIEQYQNITLPKFSHNQISILGNYVNPVTQVVEESTDVLPTELVTLFKVSVILMLFACIVHRLLE